MKVFMLNAPLSSEYVEPRVHIKKTSLNVVQNLGFIGASERLVHSRPSYMVSLEALHNIGRYEEKDPTCAHMYSNT